MRPMSVALALVFTLALSAAGCARRGLSGAGSSDDESPATVAPARAPLERQPDIGYLMHPDVLDAYRAVPGAAELEEIIRVGARALDWVDLLEKDTPPASREQIWRRVDLVGHEPTPESALITNPPLIVESYRKALKEASPVIAAVIRGDGELPHEPPEGMSVKDVVAAVRPVHVVYSRASRWLVLYQWRGSLTKGDHDLRPWLKLDHERDALGRLTRQWAKLAADERERFVAELSEACPLVAGESAESCRGSHAQVADAAAGEAAARWLGDVLARGKREHDRLFSVVERHPGVQLSRSGSYTEIQLPAYGLDNELFSWIQARLDEAWVFKPSVGVKLVATPDAGNGAIRVEWQRGALPHVNAIAGDTITMDANTPRWLEHTQTVMRHELGHALGFPDCYVEFWDEEKASFVYYSLDPADAMCALSGGFLPRHRDALLKGYP